MLSPTLLDVAAITGLKPLGDTFNPKIVSDEHEFDFTSNRAAFSTYIADHFDTTTAEVSDEEHIAFLTFWLSYFIFCSRSLQTAKLYIPLAIQLHERRNICLAKLILGDLHQTLDNAIAELKDDTPKDTFLVAGPIWLLQLWLLATFETRLNLHIPENLQQALEQRRTEGIRLAQLEGGQRNLALADRFTCYFGMFQKCTTFLDAMAPFAVRTHGPAWFKRKLGATSPEHTEETNQIWRAYLSPCILSARLSPSGSKAYLGISKYFPSYTSRQFGLCQLRPASAHVQVGDLDAPSNEFFYKTAFKHFRYKNLHFEPTRFKVKFACTEKFYKWWNDYYTTAAEGVTDEELMRKLISAIPKDKEKKTRAVVTKKKVGQIASKPPKPTTKVVKKSSPANKKQPETALTPPPASTQVPTKSPSPLSQTKLKGKSIAIDDSSEETDSDDDVPLAIHSRKRMRDQAARAARGIVIREPQEHTPEPPMKKLQTPANIPTVEPEVTPAMKEPTSTQTTTHVPTTTEQHVPETPHIEIPNETLTDQVAPMVQTPPVMGEEEVVEVTNANVEVEAPIADQDVPLVVDVEETTEIATMNSEAEMMRVIDETMQEMEDLEGEAEEAMIDKEMSGDETASQRDTSVRDSTGSAVSEQELAEMKKKNPVAALKLLLSLSSSSTNIANSTSTTSLSSINQESTEGLLRQLKAKVIEGDFLATIEKNPTESFAIKEILNKLHKSEPSPELLIFIVEFNPLLDILSLNLQRRATLAQQKNREVKLHEEKLESLKTSQDAFTNLEIQVAKDEKELADCESKIQQYSDEIRLLQAKLADVEKQKKQVQERMNIPSSEMEAKATEAIKHFDAAHQHQVNISQFDKDLSHIESTISASVAIFDRLKASLQNF